MRRPPFDALSIAIGGLGVIGFAACAWGATPLLLALVAVVALWRPLSRRLGAAAGLGASTILWMATCLVALALARGLPFSMQVEACSAMLVVIWLAPLLGGERRPPQSDGERWDVVAAASGAFVWVASVAAAHITPRGSGWSWAMYIDSSLDVFEVRRLAALGGLDSLNPGNPRPMEHALSTSNLPWHVTLDSSASTFATQVTAHALTWVLLVALACTLAGLVANEILRTRHASDTVRRVTSAVVSLGMLCAPVSGVIFIRGQINAHVVWAIAFATLLLALVSRRSPVSALALQIVATALIMLTWTPFAAIPGVLVVWQAYDLRRRRRAIAPRGRVVLLLAGGLFAWALLCFAGNDLLRSALPSSSTNERRVGVDTVLANPAWLPLTVALMFAIVWCAWALRSKADRLWMTCCGLTIAVAIGLAYLVGAGGLSLSPRTYYPAKYLHLATVILIPVVVALVVVMIGRTTRRAAVAGAAMGVALLGMSAVAPLSPQIHRWGYAPVDVTNGTWYGTRAQVAQKVLSYQANDVARLAWQAEGDFDFYVNWMLAVGEPAPPGQFSTSFRSEVRNYSTDFSIERACAIADASDRPVELITRDAELRGALAKWCPEATIAVTELSN